MHWLSYDLRELILSHFIAIVGPILLSITFLRLYERLDAKNLAQVLIVPNALLIGACVYFYNTARLQGYNLTATKHAFVWPTLLAVALIFLRKKYQLSWVALGVLFLLCVVPLIIILNNVFERSVYWPT